MKQVTSILISILLYTQFIQAQPLVYSSCYAVATNNGQLNVLFEFDPATNIWSQVGTTGTNFLDAIVIDPIRGTIYAAEGSGGTHGFNGAFGIINPVTGNFKKIGETGIANGVYGPVNLNNIDGLTFDPVNQILYANHRMEDDQSGAKDLLFQIDVSTGAFVPNAMINGTTGFATDYTVIEYVDDADLNNETHHVNDIAYNSYTGQLYAMHNQGLHSIIAEHNPHTGSLIEVLLQFDNEFYLGNSNTAGIGFIQLGELYAATGNNIFSYLDIVSGETTPLMNIDNTQENTGFGSFDCAPPKFDLALEMTLDASTIQPLKPGDMFTCMITIHNQGNLTHHGIKLTNYMPSGLSLIDANWTNLLSNTATTTLLGSLSGGDSVSIPLTLKIDDFYSGNKLINAAEITSSFNPAIRDYLGNPLPLPDIDSTPNDQNDEINIVDNEINGRGPDANEDEDDHDIVEINVNSEIANVLNLPGDVEGGVYQARQRIISNGQLVPSNQVHFEAGDSIHLNVGFSVEASTFFDAEIGVFE